MLNYLTKTDKQFKKEEEKNYDKLSNEYKYAWKTVTLPDASFSQVIIFCGIYYLDIIINILWIKID